jgi:hypothetical protein
VERLPAYARTELMDQLSASCWYFSLSILHGLHQSDAAALQNTPFSLFPLSKEIPAVAVFCCGRGSAETYVQVFDR